MKPYILRIMILASLFIGLLSTVYGLSNDFYNQPDQIGTWVGKGSTAGRIGKSGIGDFNAARTTHGLQGNISDQIGVKWKQFIGGVNLNPLLTYGGADVNGDGFQDFFFIKGGKGYLVDLASGNTIWETKVLGINGILGVEGVLGIAKKKQIVFTFGDNPYYVGILDGRTGNMITNSKIWGTLANSWTYFPNVIRDEQYDGSVIYTISRWRSPLVGIKIYGAGIDAKVDPLYENRYTDASGTIRNTSTDDYSGKVNKMTLGGKTHFLISRGSQAYIMDTSTRHPSSSGTDYSMANSHTFNISPYRSHGYHNFVYDFQDDGDDEFMLWQNERATSYQKTQLFVGGKHENQIKNFWGISWPLGTKLSKILPIKNTADPLGGYIALKLDGATSYQFYSALGANTSAYTIDAHLGSNADTTIVSPNAELMFEYDTALYGDIIGIFDNGVGTDYIVTRDASNRYNFFIVNGINTFASPAILQVSGSYYDFKNTNKTSYGLKFGNYEVKGGDMNNNGINEFAVYEGGFFKHYELSGTEKTLVSQIEYSSSENSQYTARTRQYTLDGKDLWSYRYHATDNTLKVFQTDTSNGEDFYSHLTNDFDIYSVGKTSAISIVKNNSTNYMHFGDGIYNATTATPVINPTKIASISNNSYFIDTNRDNQIDLIEGGKVYNIDDNFTKTLLYNNYGSIGDFNGDGVLDRVYVYRDSVDLYFKYYAISGVDGSQVFPTISTNNTSCGPRMFSSIRLTATDRDDLITSRSWCGHDSAVINPAGNMIYNINHMNTIQMFDIDGDGVDDIFGQDSNYREFNLQATKLSSLGVTTLFNTTIYDYVQGDIGGPITSVNRGADGVLNFVVKGLRGEIISLNNAGQILFRNHYYNGQKYSGGEDEIFNNGGVALDFADVILGDINGDDSNEIVAAGFDGWVYIIDVDTGDILYTYDIGLSIKHMAIGDSDNEGILSIIVSAEDGFVYKLTSSNIVSPLWVKDGGTYDVDIEEHLEDDQASTNFDAVVGANGYLIQLYNKTKKSPVFNWLNIGDNTNICIRSDKVVDPACITAGVDFTLSSNTIYEWKIQAYNNDVTSSVSTSNGFIVTKENSYFEEEVDDDSLFGFFRNKKTPKNYKLYGNPEFFLLNSDNSPIRSTGSIDISLTQNEYKMIYQGTTIVGTGSALSIVAPNYSCKNILASGNSVGDGIYSIILGVGDIFNAYCDMTTDGGGWTLLAKSNTSKNSYEKNINRASPFIDFYDNQVDELTDLDLPAGLIGSVLKYERRNSMIGPSQETLIKGIKGTGEYHVYKGKINLGKRLANDKERFKKRLLWNSDIQAYIQDESWETSLQTWGNKCGWIESIAGLTTNNLITAQKVGINFNQCLGEAPTTAIGIGWFIR